jgi:uncharacterized RDD family membrane protein YckC
MPMPFCANCGTEYDHGQAVCKYCKAQLPASSTIREKVDDQSESDIRAPRGIRLVAGVIDFIIASSLVILVLSPSSRLYNMVGLKKIISLLIPGIYLLLKDSIEGKSIGKLFTGLTVLNSYEERRAGLADSILRNWFLAIPILGTTVFAVFAFFQILTRNERWGDALSHTVVIKDNSLG